MVPRPKKQRPLNEVIGSNIARIRTKGWGWSQERLAEEVRKLEGPEGKGLHRVTVAVTESGKRNLSVEELFKFAAALGVSPTELLLPDKGEAVVIAPGLKFFRQRLLKWLDGRPWEEKRDPADQAEANAQLIREFAERLNVSPDQVFPTERKGK